MKSIIKSVIMVFAFLFVYLCGACASSEPFENTPQLPKETLSPTAVPATFATVPTETLAVTDTIEPTATNTAAPTLAPTSTATPKPTNTSTLAPTLTPLSEISPFTFEQLLDRVQFPILADLPGIYTVVVIQEHSILVTDDTEIEGPFGYVNPVMIGLGWVNLPDGSAQQVAYLTAGYINKAVTFTDTGLFDTDVSGLVFMGHRFRSQADVFRLVDNIQFLTEQEYFLRRRSDVDIATGVPIHNYDDWEAADWSRDDSIYRPRNGFGDQWSITLGLPGSNHFPPGTTKADIDETYGGGDIGYLVLGPWVNSLAEYAPGISAFVQSGEVSGLPTITLDGQTFPFLPGFRAKWEFDQKESDFQ